MTTISMARIWFSLRLTTENAAIAVSRPVAIAPMVFANNVTSLGKLQKMNQIR